VILGSCQIPTTLCAAAKPLTIIIVIATQTQWRIIVHLSNCAAQSIGNGTAHGSSLKLRRQANRCNT
jgi:hypothetical protein